MTKLFPFSTLPVGYASSSVKFVALCRYQILVGNSRYYWWGCNFVAVRGFAFCALVLANYRCSLVAAIYVFNQTINRMERSVLTFARGLLNRSSIGHRLFHRYAFKIMKPNTEKYFNMLMAEMTAVIRPDEMVKNEELKQAVMNTLLDKDGPRTVSTPPQPKDLFVGYKLFKGFSEIHTAVECLKNIEIYIRRFPFKNTRVSKLDYLKYNIENYLNEIYVLKERMISYSKTVARAYKNSENSQVVESNLREASLLVIHRLDPMPSIESLAKALRQNKV